MRQLTTIGAVADEAGVLPRIISDAFYRRKLDRKKCVVIGGRLVIPVSYVPEILRVLRELGKLPASTVAAG